MVMLITFTCPKCKASLEIEADAAGTQIECPECHTALTVPKKGPGPGTTVGGFRIEKLLGKGGMGEVYLARQLSMDREVALKILPAHFAEDKRIELDIERYSSSLPSRLRMTSVRTMEQPLLECLALDLQMGE